VRIKFLLTDTDGTINYVRKMDHLTYSIITITF